MSTALLLAGCGGGGEAEILDAGYLSLNGSYICKPRPPFDTVYSDSTIRLTATETAATISGETIYALSRWHLDSSGLPLYTDAEESPITSIITFDANRTMLFAQGTLTDPSTLNITASYVGDCTKQ